jgi:hypothetical protein
MRYFSDNQRHLVCWPYSVENLHEMARKLGIKRCWFHGGRNAHYDVPVLRMNVISYQTEVVSPRVIVNIIKGKEPPEPFDAFKELVKLLDEGDFKVWFHQPGCAIWKSVGGSHKCDKACGPPA